MFIKTVSSRRNVPVEPLVIAPLLVKVDINELGSPLNGWHETNPLLMKTPPDSLVKKPLCCQLDSQYSVPPASFVIVPLLVITPPLVNVAVEPLTNVPELLRLPVTCEPLARVISFSLEKVPPMLFENVLYKFNETVP